VRRQGRVIALALLAACGAKKHAAQRDADAGSATPVVVDAAAPLDAAISAVRSEHVAFALVDNRHAAHRAIAGELVIDAGDIGFARYTRFGLPVPHWHLGQIVDKERVAIADRFASLEVPLPVAARDHAQQITMRIHADAKQSLIVRANGRKAGTVALDAGWQTIAVPVAKGGFIVGENELSLETAGKKAVPIALAWLRIGASSPAPGDDPRAAATFDAKADAIELANGAELAWYVTIPDGANLIADVAAPCRVEVAARAGDDSLAGGTLAADHPRVDLSASAGKVVRLALIAHDCPKAHIAHAQITLLGAAPPPPPKADPPRFVIVWVLDGLRADRVLRAPNFDELARSSTSFREAYAQGNESQASHASLWTSLYPAVHGVRLAGISPRTSKLDPRLATLPVAAGLGAFAFTANPAVSAADGYARGFTELHTTLPALDAALAALGAHRDAPALIFVETIAHEALLHLAPNAMGCKTVPPDDAIAQLRASYDAATQAVDQQLGKLVAQLEAWGIWDQTMLIVTSDHGEELFEDGRCGHGVTLRDSVVHVPLVIHDPARFPAGTIVDEGVEAIDVAPTILAALGRPALPGAQGESLEPLARGVGRGWARPAFASMYEYAFAMRIGRWKARIGQTAVPLVADVVADPDEKNDLAASHPVERRMLTDNLGLMLALRTRWQKSSWGVTTNLTAEGAAALDGASTP